jgi:hypothetical protein
VAKRAKGQSAADVRDALLVELARRMDECATASLSTLNDRVCSYFDGKWQAYREMRAWLEEQ